MNCILGLSCYMSKWLNFHIFFLQNGNIKRIEEKEKERYTRELQISDVDLVHIDEREKQMVVICFNYCNLDLFDNHIAYGF